MTDDPTAAEIARLQTRVAELEGELAEQQRRTNAIVAESQERTYWLDRWHIDLNEVMRRPGADTFRAAVRGVRPLVRMLRQAKRRLAG